MAKAQHFIEVDSSLAATANTLDDFQRLVIAQIEPGTIDFSEVEIAFRYPDHLHSQLSKPDDNLESAGLIGLAAVANKPDAKNRISGVISRRRSLGLGAALLGILAFGSVRTNRAAAATCLGQASPALCPNFCYCNPAYWGSTCFNNCPYPSASGDCPGNDCKVKYQDMYKRGDSGCIYCRSAMVDWTCC